MLINFANVVVRFFKVLLAGSTTSAKSINLEVYMATLQQRIAEKFLTKLAESNQVDAERIGELRKLLADGKKLKADDLVKISSRLVPAEI